MAATTKKPAFYWITRNDDEIEDHKSEKSAIGYGEEIVKGGGDKVFVYKLIAVVEPVTTKIKVSRIE